MGGDRRGDWPQIFPIAAAFCNFSAGNIEVYFGRLLVLFSRACRFLSDCSTCKFDVSRRFNDLRRAAFFFAMPVPLWLASSHSYTVFRMMKRVSS